MDPDEIAAIGRRAALMAFAGSALLGASGCQAVQAIIARLHGDDSFDEGGDGADKRGDNGKLQGKRSEQGDEPPSGSVATSNSSSGSDASGETFVE